MTDVRIKSFRNNSLVTDNSLYRLSSRKSQTFFNSALIGLFELNSTAPSFEIGQFYLTFAGNRCGTILFSPPPLDRYPSTMMNSPSEFVLNFSHEIHDVLIVNQSKPYDQMHPVTRSSK